MALFLGKAKITNLSLLETMTSPVGSLRQILDNLCTFPCTVWQSFFYEIIFL
jgi:hypothetical protein